MKYTTIFLILNLAGVYAQDNFISSVKVEYDVVRLNGNKVRELKATLLFNSTDAVFMYKNGSEQKETSSIAENNENNYTVNYKAEYIDTLANKMYFNTAEKTLIQTALDFNTNDRVYIRDSLEMLEWNITAETKKIQSFECIKAKLSHKGNRYVAWFTTAIPTTFGPYDFGQLLGLILELYSEDRQLYIAATKVTSPFEQAVLLPASSTDYISRSDYDALTKKFLDSVNTAIKDRTTRILTKSQRGLKISNIKVETKTTKSDTKNKGH